MKRIITIVALLLCAALKAQTFNKVKMDSLFSLMQEKNKGMGSVSVFKNGKEIYQKSIGYSSIASKTLADARTKYRIGSITKTFTSTMIMQLIDEKKLKLNTLLSDYFPEIPNAQKITIEHLLRHRSGLFNITNDENFRTWMVLLNSRQQMLDRIIEKEIVFQPEEKTAYSNTNYLLLSYILEEIEGASYAEILQSRIVKPLKLKRTAYGKKIDITKNESLSYSMESSNWELVKNETHMSVPVGAGAIVSTPTELNIFYDNLFSKNLVSDSSFIKMIDVSTGMGLGLSGRVFFDHQAYGHNGGIDGFQSLTLYIPDEKLGVSYIGNGVVLSPESIVRSILKICFNKEHDFSEFKDVVKMKTEELTIYLGTYVGDEFPFQISIKNDKGTLILDAKDGPTFPLDAFDTDKFRSDAAGVMVNFFPEKNKMILHYEGKSIEFIRK